MLPNISVFLFSQWQGKWRKDFCLDPVLVGSREISLSLEEHPVKVASHLWGSLKLHQYQLRWIFDFFKILAKDCSCCCISPSLGWNRLKVNYCAFINFTWFVQITDNFVLLSFFVGVASGRAFSFNKGINFVKVFKKGLLIYINDNALILDYGGSFSKTVKIVCIKNLLCPSHWSYILGFHVHFQSQLCNTHLNYY